MRTPYQIAFIGFLLLISCQQDIETEIEIGRPPRIAYSSLDKEEKLANALKSVSASSNKGGRVLNELENINPDSILKVLQSDSISYTFTMRLKNGNSLSSFKIWFSEEQ